NVTCLRREFAADLTSPGTVFESLVLPCHLLNWRDVFPGLEVPGTVPVMQGIDHTKSRLPGRTHNLQHMRNAVVRFGYGLDATPELPAFGNEIVIGIDHNESGNLLVINHLVSEPGFRRPRRTRGTRLGHQNLSVDEGSRKSHGGGSK